MCYDPAEAIHLFTTECDSLGDVDSFIAAETPQQCQDFNAPRSLLKIDPALTQNAIQVQAYPWTDVASDQGVSEIISQFILDDRPLALPVVDVQKLVEEMKGCDPASATCCSPLLVNAICAQQCVKPTPFPCPSLSGETARANVCRSTYLPKPSRGLFRVIKWASAS